MRKKRAAADRIHEFLREVSKTNKAAIAIRRLRMFVVHLQRWLRSCLADKSEKLAKMRQRWEHIAGRDKTALLKKYNKLHGAARERATSPDDGNNGTHALPMSEPPHVGALLLPMRPRSI